MNRSLMPKYRASAVAALTVTSLPQTMSTRPMMLSTSSIHRGREDASSGGVSLFFLAIRNR